MKDIEAKKVDLNDEAMANVVGGAEEAPYPGSFRYGDYWYVVANPQPTILNNYKWCYRIVNGNISGIIIQIPNSEIHQE